MKRTKKSVRVSKKPTRVSRKQARVSADKAFWLKSNHGQVVAVCHSIKELADVVDKSSDDVFYFHTDGRNDFAAWINNTFKDESLAKKVSDAKTKKEFLRLLRGEN